MYNKADKTAHGWEKWFFYGFYPVHLLLLWMIQFAKYRGNGYNNTGGVTNAEKTQKDSSGIFLKQAGREYGKRKA